MTLSRRRWLMVAFAFTATLINYLDRQALSVAAPVLREQFGMSNSTCSRVVFAFLPGYTGASANPLSLPADAYPRDAVASVCGLASMGSGFGGMVFTLLIGAGSRSGGLCPRLSRLRPDAPCVHRHPLAPYRPGAQRLNHRRDVGKHADLRR